MKAENLMVKPIDQESLVRHIESLIKPSDNESYKTLIVALVGEDIVTDTECCYSFIPNKLNNGKIQLVYEVSVRVVTQTTTGRSIPMYPSFYIDIPVEYLLSKFTKPSISLREFMGSRYNYNPRIIQNTKEFLTEITTLTIK